MSSVPLISLIAAVAKNNVIGRNGQIPWRLPEDMKFFKETTLGKPIIMGRRTWESIGKPLPERTNIVITSNASFNEPGVTTASRFEDALTQAQALAPDEIVVIGGAGVYRLALPIAGRFYLTEVDGEVEGDTYFPTFDRSFWREVERRHVPKLGKATHACTIITLDRMSS